MTRFNFDENNSGGRWWLSKKDYQKLFAAGWKLDEVRAAYYTDRDGISPKDVPWAWRHNLYFKADSLDAAIESWSKATHKDYEEEGCSCCGRPFSIYEEWKK